MHLGAAMGCSVWRRRRRRESFWWLIGQPANSKWRVSEPLSRELIVLWIYFIQKHTPRGWMLICLMRFLIRPTRCTLTHICFENWLQKWKNNLNIWRTLIWGISKTFPWNKLKETTKLTVKLHELNYLLQKLHFLSLVWDYVRLWSWNQNFIVLKASHFSKFLNNSSLQREL